MRRLPNDEIKDAILCSAALVVAVLCLVGAIVQITRNNMDTAAALILAGLALAVPTMLFSKRKIDEGR